MNWHLIILNGGTMFIVWIVMILAMNNEMRQRELAERPRVTRRVVERERRNTLHNERGQTKKGSLVEALVSTAIGYVVALGAQAVILPLFGFHASTREHASIAALFTLVSIVRGYLVRRLFNWIGSSNRNTGNL